MSDEPEVLVERRGRAGVLTLNRPRAINALTHSMVRSVSAALDSWADDPDVQTVVITGSGDRGLCAGGDIVALYHDAKDGDGTASGAFWRDEYRMNSQLASYPKPVVAVQDGIVLGGGIGISAHCTHRIVTERSKLGLPEVGIGFVPDVGATWLLSRPYDESGTAIALSARSVGPADAIVVGLSDVFIPSERIPQLLDALETEEPAAAIAPLSEDAPVGELGPAQEWIHAAFSGDDVGVIVERLRELGEPAASFLRGIERSSPMAVAVTLASMRRAARLDSLEDVLVQEYRVSMHALRADDFVEGVRAQVIDKDRTPRWTPANPDLVDPDEVSKYFEVPTDGDLDLSSKEKR